jgi:hypothetical protein
VAELADAADLKNLSGKMEVAAGLEPAKTGFADQRLDRFGIATSKRLNQPIPKLYPNAPNQA